MSDVQRILAATAFAVRMHGDQKRKYTGEPYVTHCLEVAEIVRSVGGDCNMICAAILHDVVEDTDATVLDVEQVSGAMVASHVWWLTKISTPEDGNRAQRMAIDREHIAKAPDEVKTIKLADLISNTSSIVERDPGFAKVYLPEKLKLLTVLTEGQRDLWREAHHIATKGQGDDGR